MACCRNIHLFILHICFECDLWLGVRQLKWCHSTVRLHWHRQSFFSSAEKTKQRTTLTSTMGWNKRQGSVLTRACTASLYFYLFLSCTHRETNTKCTRTYLDNIQKLLLGQEGLLTCCQLRVSKKSNVTGQKIASLNQKWMIYLFHLTHTNVITPNNPTNIHTHKQPE